LPEGITLEVLKQSHTSKPRNLLIADVCFKGGLIDAWGRGTISIIEECKAVGLPEPELAERFGGFMVTLFKDRFSAEQLQQLGLNERQIKAVLYVIEKGEITTSVYTKLYAVAERTARNDLNELSDKQIFKRIGETNLAKYVLD
jgi:ATP-dependent DNA helicase RecG